MAMTGLALHGNQRKKAVQLPGQQTGFPETQLRPNRIQALCNFELKFALVRTYADVQGNHTLQMAAALSYYFVMSLFPALTFLSAIVAFLPVPDLFNQTLT